MIDVRFHRLASQELRDVFEWYAERDLLVADRFLSAAEDAVERIRAAPHTHPAEFDDVRWVRVRQFPYRLIFEHQPDADGVLVLAIAHTSREPLYWQDRT